MRQKKTKKKGIVRELFSWMFYLVVIFGVVFLMIHFVGEKTVVSGDSMRPTLANGDNIIVDKISYRFISPSRYDIVVFPFKYQDDTYYIKRVIGLPGETVQIQDGKIFVNGKALNENYGNEQIRNPGLASDAIILGQDEYFVLGDNRNSSADSREPSVGNVSKDNIIGRAFFRIWPASDIGMIS